jgi:hypothetical protein
MDRLLRWAAFASLAAGMSHGLNIQEHLNEWWGYGLFFLFAAAGQVVYALVLIVRPWQYDETGGRRDGARQARWLYLAGIAANCFFIVLYLVTRTVGIPFLGPAAGQVEPVSLLGVLTKLTEAALVACLFALVRRTPLPPASQ